MIIISDIDGTLADISTRLKRAGKQPSYRYLKRFQAWLDKLQDKQSLLDDAAISGMKELLLTLAKKFTIIYLTGRSKKYYEVTQKWLKKHGFPKGKLIMRPNTSYCSARLFKEKEMLKIAKKAKGQQLIIFDDDGDGTCSAMYKKHGWTHLKVMECV